jgi:hypothetical protein
VSSRTAQSINVGVGQSWKRHAMTSGPGYEAGLVAGFADTTDDILATDWLWQIGPGRGRESFV